jgi:autotransporter translocation and assembly factor TamB
MLTLAEQLEALPTVALLLPLKFTVKLGHAPGDLGVGGQVRDPVLLGLLQYVDVRRKLAASGFEVAGVGLPIAFPDSHGPVEPGVGLF